MHSSTSSSDGEVELPARPAQRLLLAAVIAGALSLVAIELAWRSLGFVPSARDTMQLWGRVRDEARGSKDVLVIVGSSRAQIGLDPAVVSAELNGRRVLQLGLTGGSALPVLRDLAEDSEFRGVVLCEVTPASFFVPVASISQLSGSEKVRGWHHLPLVSNLETRLRLAAQQRLALLTPETNPRFQLSAFLTQRSLAPPPVVHIRADRFGEADYRGADVARMRAHWAKGIKSAHAELDATGVSTLAKTAADWVARIRGRGGDVIFVRLPSSDEVFAAEEQVWPRERFWDAFVGESQSRAIYFADEPTLREIPALEGSHLDARDAVTFSRELTRILIARGWLHTW